MYHSMPGVLERLFRPQKKAMHDHRTMELQAAREILAEVFGVQLSEVDEMISSRFEAEDRCIKEEGLWPREFCMK